MSSSVFVSVSGTILMEEKRKGQKNYNADNVTAKDLSKKRIQGLVSLLKYECVLALETIFLFNSSLHSHGDTHKAEAVALSLVKIHLIETYCTIMPSYFLRRSIYNTKSV